MYYILYNPETYRVIGVSSDSKILNSGYKYIAEVEKPPDKNIHNYFYKDGELVYSPPDNFKELFLESALDTKICIATLELLTETEE